MVGSGPAINVPTLRSVFAGYLGLCNFRFCNFCGWLCPFGAMQEILAELAGWLGLKQFRLNDALDAALKNLKYLLLLGLIAVTIFVPNEIDTAAEVEPFKTAITVFFIREWYYVLYAVLCLGLGCSFTRGFADMCVPWAQRWQ